LASLEVRHLEAAAAWSNGPAAFGISFSAAALAKLPAGSLKSSVVAPSQAAGSARAGALRSGQQAGGMPVTLVFACAGNDGGVVISNFFVSSGTSAVAAVHGFLPLSLNPGLRTNLLQLDFQKPLQLTANVYPEPSVWNEVAERTGMALRQPRLSLDLSGTWSEPRGTVHLAAQAVEFRTTKAKLPTLTELVVVAELERQRVRLTQGQVRVQAQPLTLTAELPLGVGFWNRLNERRLPDLEQATAHLRVQDAELSAFAELFPKILSPQGQLNLELDLLPGFKLNGEFVVQGARSRPLATLGPIRDINLKMKFHERTLELEQATAKLGPSIVTLAGLADFQGTNWMKEGIPSLDITLRGTNVPLARQPESVIRSDLNLRLVKKIGAAPLITGTARLRDSFYLSDLAALAPGKVAGPGLRPPFFSLDEPFLAGSKLNVAVTGVRFLKVRSPVFNGEVSANLKLQGTLQDPIALGDMRIDSGTVNFPFASLQVQQGFVTLASEDPYRPQLALSATSRQFGYDIKMEVSGSADAPILQFSSSPPLSSEQILLLVTAGEIPRQEQVLSAQQRAQTFALFLGKDLLSKLGLGDQGEQRLIIHSGQELTQTGKPTYNIEYKLTRRWSLVGEQDQFNDLNAGMKWRVYSK
jgi:translocation and assembly module TamB